MLILQSMDNQCRLANLAAILICRKRANMTIDFHNPMSVNPMLRRGRKCQHFHEIRQPNDNISGADANIEVNFVGVISAICQQRCKQNMADATYVDRLRADVFFALKVIVRLSWMSAKRPLFHANFEAENAISFGKYELTLRGQARGQQEWL